MERPESEVRRQRPEKVKEVVVETREFRNMTLEEEHVAELEYTPSKANGTYRLIVLRKKIRVTKGQLRLEDEIRYFFYVTNISSEELSTAGIVRESNARCHQENLIEQLKNGVQAMRLPALGRQRLDRVVAGGNAQVETTMSRVRNTRMKPFLEQQWVGAPKKRDRGGSRAVFNSGGVETCEPGTLFVVSGAERRLGDEAAFGFRGSFREVVPA